MQSHPTQTEEKKWTVSLLFMLFAAINPSVTGAKEGENVAGYQVATVLTEMLLSSCEQLDLND